MTGSDQTDGLMGWARHQMWFKHGSALVQDLLKHILIKMFLHGCPSACRESFRVVTRDVQIIALSIFGPCCDDVIPSALALQVGKLWRQNLKLKRESTHFEGR